MTSSDPPRSLVPDRPDWTWVLERPCPECGVDVAELDIERTPTLIRENATAWVELLAGPDLSTPRKENHWSPLEYACHVRDVFELYHYRLGLMLSEDGPHYPNWDQDLTAIDKDYPSSDPAVVAVELTEQAHLLASRFETVTGDDWARTGFRSDGAAFTIASFARYLLHDPIHHLWDVR
ncbi:MAG: DinB family protein [Actinomycetota bacterium]|nr:DinB family protein [Actinomycetota bacterium]